MASDVAIRALQDLTGMTHCPKMVAVGAVKHHYLCLGREPEGEEYDRDVEYVLDSLQKLYDAIDGAPKIAEVN